MGPLVPGRERGGSGEGRREVGQWAREGGGLLARSQFALLPSGVAWQGREIGHSLHYYPVG